MLGRVRDPVRRSQRVIAKRGEIAKEACRWVCSYGFATPCIPWPSFDSYTDNDFSVTVSYYLGDMALCTENNRSNAYIIFSNFQADSERVLLARQIVGGGVSLSFASDNIWVSLCRAGKMAV